MRCVCKYAKMMLFSPVFLSTELQALKILNSKKTKGSHLEKHNEVYQEVQAICDALGLSNSSASDIPPLLTSVEQKVCAVMCSVVVHRSSVSIHLEFAPSSLIRNGPMRQVQEKLPQEPHGKYSVPSERTSFL